MSDSVPGPLMMDLEGEALRAEERELLAHPLVGSLILFARNYRDPAQLTALCAEARSVRPGLLIVADYEGGRVQRFREGFTVLPPMRSLGRLHERDPAAAAAAALACGLVIGAELGAVGVDMPLAPVLDLDRGLSAVIGSRALHGDADVVAELAAAFRRGLGAAGMAATGKHFPGHGGVAPDSHAELPVDTRDVAALAEDMRPYRALIDDGLESVMMAHIRYPAVDENPASLSRRWIRGWLRERLGFRGGVFCDDLSMGAVTAAGDYPARARAALDAGCDILPVCNNRDGLLRILERLAPGPDDGAGARRRRLTRRSATVSAVELDKARARVAELAAADASASEE